MAIYLILLDGIRWYKPILRRNHDSNGTILFKPCLRLGVFPWDSNWALMLANLKGMLGVTMFAKAKLQREFVRWTGPRCAAVTDIQGDTPGPKKNGFLHGKTGPVLWMDQVSWDDSCRLHWALSPSQLIHVLFGATTQWRSGIGSPRVWNLAGSYLNRTQMISFSKFWLFSGKSLSQSPSISLSWVMFYSPFA